jgi:hypothetical protein
MEDEDDEETQEWEMAQVRRAGGWKEEEPEKPTKASYQPTPSEFFNASQVHELMFSAKCSSTTYNFTRSNPPRQFASPA